MRYAKGRLSRDQPVQQLQSLRGRHHQLFSPSHVFEDERPGVEHGGSQDRYPIILHCSRNAAVSRLHRAESNSAFAGSDCFSFSVLQTLQLPRLVIASTRSSLVRCQSDNVAPISLSNATAGKLCCPIS